MYSITYSPQAQEDLKNLKKTEPSAFAKITKLLDELVDHPTTGTGKPHLLTGDRSGQWSRRITQKHRLVYEIIHNEVRVWVVSAYGHYDDK